MSGEDKAIHEAAREGNVKKLKALLAQDPALIHEEGSWGRMPLHAAAEAGEVECVRFLIEQGAEVDARDGLHSLLRQPFNFCSSLWLRAGLSQL